MPSTYLSLRICFACFNNICTAARIQFKAMRFASILNLSNLEIQNTRMNDRNHKIDARGIRRKVCENPPEYSLMEWCLWAPYQSCIQSNTDNCHWGWTIVVSTICIWKWIREKNERNPCQIPSHILHWTLSDTMLLTIHDKPRIAAWEIYNLYNLWQAHRRQRKMCIDVSEKIYCILKWILGHFSLSPIVQNMNLI